MASTLVKGSLAQVAEAKSRIAIPPVPILDSPVSKSVALLRPVILLALLAATFQHLVADPVSTLQYALPVVVLLQAAYAIICLPAAGSQNARRPRLGDKKRGDLSSPKAVPTAIIALLLTSIITPAIHVLFVLFGAPFLTHIAHTFLCAAHFSLLAVFPILYTRGSDGQSLIAVVGASAPLDETFGGLVGAVVGAWLGAVPIPLDWDRDWQKWPVTIFVGLYAGSLLGSFVAGTLFYGSRFEGTRDQDE